MKLFIEITLLLFIACLNFHAKAAGSSFYVSYDKNGNPIYSDKQPESRKYHEKKAHQVITTNWEKTPTIKPLTSPPQRSFSTDTTSQTECKKITKKISKINANLKIRLTASVFNNLKKQLSKLRWSKHTKC